VIKDRLTVSFATLRKNPGADGIQLRPSHQVGMFKRGKASLLSQRRARACNL
jgi:hypothetical protein